MAGADDRIVFQLALVQRAAAVRATVDEPIEAPFFAHQQHGGTVGLCAGQLSFLKLIFAEDRGPLFRRVLERRLVHADSPGEGEMPAEVGGECRDGVPQRGEGHAGGPVAPPSRRPRKRMQRQRGRVAERVHTADPAAATGEFGPVGQAGCDSGHCGEDAGGNEAVRSLLRLLAAEEIEEQRARPGPDHDVGQGRVERLAEPGAAHDVLQRRLLRHHLPHRLLQRLQNGVERFKLLDRFGDPLAHRFLLRSRSPVAVATPGNSRRPAQALNPRPGRPGQRSR